MWERRAEEREQKYMDSITNMMSVMPQFVGAMSHAYGFPSIPPSYPPSAPSFLNTPPMLPFQTNYPMPPYTGSPTSTATSTGTWYAPMTAPATTTETTTTQSFTADLLLKKGVITRIMIDASD